MSIVNGIISYNKYWNSLINPKHNLHKFKNAIEDYLFKKDNNLIKEWMVGKYTSEDIHRILGREIGTPYEELFNQFVEDCKKYRYISKSACGS